MRPSPLWLDTNSVVLHRATANEYVIDKLLGLLPTSDSHSAKLHWLDYGSKGDTWDPWKTFHAIWWCTSCDRRKRMYRGTSGKHQHGEVADKAGSEPWPTSSWNPRGYPLCNMSMFPVKEPSMPMSGGQIQVPPPHLRKEFLSRGSSRPCCP